MEHEEIIYDIDYTKQFKKDYKKYRNNLKKVEKSPMLFNYWKRRCGEYPTIYETSFFDWKLSRVFRVRLESDLLIIWLQYDEEKKKIVLARLGSHSELFK